MARSRSRRLLSLLAGVVVGLVGTLAPAGPAGARHGGVSGRATCDAEAGEWVVTWTVSGGRDRDRARAHELLEVVAEPGTGTLVDPPTHVVLPIGEAFTIEQRLPGDATSASLAVRGKRYFLGYDGWYARVESDFRQGSVTLQGACRKPAPVEVDAVSSCTGLVVTVSNPTGGVETTASVRSSVGDRQRIPLAPGESQTVSFPDSDDLEVVVVVGDLRETLRWEPPDCTPPEPGPVEVTSRSSCEGLTLDLRNPRDGVDAVATVTPSVGGPQEVAVPVGDSATVTVPGAEGLSVDVAVDEQTWVFAWVPGDCAVDIPIGFASDCDTLTVEITNPQVAGALEATVATTERTRTATVAPLETTEVVVPAESGTVATVTAGREVVEAEWQPPEDCLTDTLAAGGLRLPGTGSAIAGAALLASTMIGLGVALYVGSGRRPGLRRRPRHRKPA